MKVIIPFKTKWRLPIHAGWKTATTRTKKYGKAGDTFEVFGDTFELTEVRKVTLLTVSLRWHKEEDCETPDDFIRVWREIHPRKGFVKDQPVYLHLFKKLEPSELKSNEQNV